MADTEVSGADGLRGAGPGPALTEATPEEVAHEEYRRLLVREYNQESTIRAKQATPESSTNSELALLEGSNAALAAAEAQKANITKLQAESSREIAELQAELEAKRMQEAAGRHGAAMLQARASKQLAGLRSNNKQLEGCVRVVCACVARGGW